jgi:pimeloyl-ACP methyl ester carboxylesterase
MGSKTVLFIHGLYMTPLCWENWIQCFESKGFQTLAPAYPGRDKSVQELQIPEATLRRLTLWDILDHLTAKIKALEEKPVLVGHSMGGLIAQILLHRGFASAAVAIDSAAPAGLFTAAYSYIKANCGHITPFANLNSPVVMSFKRFQYAFVNDMPLVEQRAAFERYIVPESRHIPRDSLFAKIDFRKPHAPLLLIAGGNDHIIPPGLNKTNYRKYTDRSSITDFKEFPGRNHFILGQPGWEEVADYCMDWISKRA